MDVTLLTARDLRLLAMVSEGHFYDRKSARIAPAKLTKTVSAFANADGGELVVGIEDDGSWAGLESVESWNGHIQALEAVFPYGSEFRYEFFEHPDDHTIALRLLIEKSRDVRFAADGKAYVRRAAQSLPVADLEALRRHKGLVSIETETIRYDLEELTNSVAVIGFMLGVIPEAEPDLWLSKQRLIIDGVATVAGTLLFHDEPQVYLPKASVKLYRYSTSDEEGSREQLAYDPITIEGNAYSVIASAVAQTVQQVEQIPLLASETGFTNFTYPRETLHEIITNAVIHRDYAVNDDVHVRIFNNRIEVQSPGALPAHITPENILAERFSRNPVIVRLLNKFPDPPNKDVGEGLNTAFAAMRKLELVEPQILDTGSSVLVVIRHESLADPEDRIAGYLRRNNTINNKEARTLLNRPDAERSIRRIFQKMESAHLLERVPGTSRGGSRYRLRTDESLPADEPA